MNKCPQCGGYNVAKIDPPAGSDKYFAPSIDTKSNSINIGNGIPLDAYGCMDCKAVYFKSSALRRN